MSKFTLSCTTCALRGYGEDEVAETLTHAPIAGFDHWGLVWPQMKPEWRNADRLKQEASNAGIVGCTELYTRGFDPTSTENALAGVEELCEWAKFAVALGSPLLVFSGRQRQEGSRGLESVVAGLNVLLPMLDELPIRVALEPHHGSQFQFIEDYDFIFDRVNHPSLGITVDTGHFHASGVDTVALIRKYSEKIWNIHLKDHTGSESVSIGRGAVDFGLILSELHEIEYEGALALEIEPKDHSRLPEFVAESYEVMCQLVSELNKV